MNKTIQHIRGLNANGGVTTVATYDAQTDTTTIKYAICNIADSYNKKLGVSLAKSSDDYVFVDGKISNVGHTLRMLLDHSNSSHTITKSILHSMLEFIPTKGYINLANRNHLLATFLNVSHVKGHLVTRKEIDILFTLKQA